MLTTMHLTMAATSAVIRTVVRGAAILSGYSDWHSYSL